MIENTELEKIVLGYLLADVKYLGVSQQYLNPAFFTAEKYKKLFMLASASYSKWHTVLDYEFFKKKLKNSKLEPEQETEFLLLYKELKQAKIDDTKFNFYTDQLKDATIKRGMKTLVDKYSKILQDDKIEDAEILTNQLAEDVHKVRLDSNLLQVNKSFVYENVESRIAEYDERKKVIGTPGIPFGFKVLDELTGGYFKQELITIFARTGQGKTRFMHNMAYNATVAKKKGMFITIEMSAKEICRLYDSRLTKLHYLDIKKGKLDETGEMKWKGLIRMMENQNLQKGFCVVDIPTGCTVDSVEQEIHEYERRFGKLDFVTIDYLLLMESTKKGLDRTHAVGDIAAQLKKLARKKDVAIITATQANRSAQDVDLKQEDVSDRQIGISDQISHHSNLILYVWHSTKDDIERKIQVKVVKFRDGVGKTFSLYVDWARNFIGDEIWRLGVEDDIKKEIK